MTQEYFVKYKTDQKTEPYKLPDNIRNDLTSIEGLKITYESITQPLVIVSIPKDKLDDVKSLESIISVYEDKQFILQK